jgi:microcompartment protein CcmL/EutN
VSVHVIPRPHGDLETSMPMISGKAPAGKKGALG